MRSGKNTPHRVLKTFQNATPETDDVVLCDACGSVLHSEEDGVFWGDNASHFCGPMKDDVIAQLTSQLAVARKPVTFAETDKALQTVKHENVPQCDWLSDPLFLARLLSTIIADRDPKPEGV